MKIKIVGIFAMTLILAASAVPVLGTINDGQNNTGRVDKDDFTTTDMETEACAEVEKTVLHPATGQWCEKAGVCQEPQIAQMQGEQPDIKVWKCFPPGWIDNNLYDTITDANPTLNFIFFHYYIIQVENDGPGHMNGTVSFQLANHTYPFFFARLKYEKPFENGWNFISFTNTDHYIDTGYIRYLTPGEKTYMYLCVFSLSCFNAQDSCWVTVHEAPDVANALTDMVRLV